MKSFTIKVQSSKKYDLNVYFDIDVEKSEYEA